MTPTQLVRVVRTPASRVTTTGAAGSGLPPDLLAVASRRLGILALVTVAICVINVLVAHLEDPWHEEQADQWWRAHLPVTRPADWTSDPANASHIAAIG
jgi:hypothetical protein